MNSDEAMFLAAITASPDDEATHQAYADWLDENDRPDEADWHRAFRAADAQAARAWFVTFAQGHFEGYAEPEREWTADEVIEAGRRWLTTPSDPAHYTWRGTTQHGSQSLQDEMYSQSTREEFWRHLALATGTYVPQDTAEDGYVFGCSC